MPRPEVCVGAIAIDNDRLLVVRRAHEPGAGKWSVPGGRVEEGETLVEAVVREVAEETGLEAVCGELLGWVERLGDGYHHVILDFRAEVLEAGDPVAADDAAEAAWVPLPQVGELDVVDGLVEFLHDHGIVAVIA